MVTSVVGAGDDDRSAGANPARTRSTALTAQTASAASEKKLQVNITYNGTTLAFDYSAHEEGEALYKQAFSRFQVPKAEQAGIALYLPDNTTEVNPKVSLEQSHVQPHTTLILRGRQSGGGR
jgi:hypothetical protein